MAGEAKAKRARTREQAAPAGPPDGFDLRKDGTVWAVVDGERHTWRRPKIGELRKLREAVAERDAKMTEATEARRAERASEGGHGDDTADAVAAVAGALADLGDLQTELNLEWLETAWRTLGDREPPPTDEWPSGSDSTGMITALLKHWREVPLHSGA